MLNKVDCIGIFIKHKDKIDVRIRGKHGRTALHYSGKTDQFYNDIKSKHQL